MIFQVFRIILQKIEVDQCLKAFVFVLHLRTIELINQFFDVSNVDKHLIQPFARIVYRAKVLNEQVAEFDAKPLCHSFLCCGRIILSDSPKILPYERDEFSDVWGGRLRVLLNFIVYRLFQDHIL